MLPQNTPQQVAPMNQNIAPRFPGSPMSRPQIVSTFIPFNSPNNPIISINFQRNTFSPQMNSPMMRANQMGAHNGQQSPMAGSGTPMPQGYQAAGVRFPVVMNSPQMGAGHNGTDRKKHNMPTVATQLHMTPDKGKIM